ncbi:hypothetical protein PH552_27475 [Rhizobium sp. CNPSo 3968]|uniref:hypothetical protein n=1 Tax=Rhizobium sp. CNPSo 3968 TaxID=3021408 RepID=UPI00146B7D1A|nr:hypothetical protein [Rhizobium sp. CNPSo 3968]MDK4723099.1 hypothetical protein [Rhizobium sp. CNPSo 3968]
MTRSIKVEVGDGWAAIVLNLIVVGSAYPEHWKFRFHRAWRACGRMRIYVTTDCDEVEAANATTALSEIAWHRSGQTCEVCGRGGYLRLGKRYALTLCRDHEHLVDERHPDDGKINDLWKAHVDGFIKLPPDYGLPAVMKDELLRMWSHGEVDMREVMELLQMSRTAVMSAAIDAGYGLRLEDDDDDDEKGAEFARMIAATQDDGTRH